MSDINNPDTQEHDKTYENEQSMVSIPLRDYDKLKDQVTNQGKYVTDPGLISVIDKIEELVRALRKHIHSQY